MFRQRGSALLGTALTMTLGGAGGAWAAPIKIMPLGDSITYGVESDEGGGVNHGGYRFGLWNLLQGSGSPYQGNVDFVGDYHVPDATHGGLSGNQSYDADNEGVSGVTISELKNGSGSYLGVNHAISTYAPDVILLNIGSNNLTRPLGSGETRADSLNNALGEMYDLLETIYHPYNPPASPVHVYVSSITGVADNYVWGPPPGYGTVEDFQNEIKAFNNAIPGVIAQLESDYPASNLDITYVGGIYDALDYSTTSSDFTYVHNNSNVLGPGLHPSWQGYNKLAQVWYDALVPEPGALSVLLLGVVAMRRRGGAAGRG
jgi:lysophospholipase L1-like esterase